VRQMRIWIIHHYAYTPSQSAGTRHHAIARELIDRGHEVLIVACSFYHKSHRHMNLEPGRTWGRTVEDGVPFHWIRAPSYRGNGLGRVANMLVFAHRAGQGAGLDDAPAPDVVVGSSPDLFTADAARRLARRRGVPFVLELRDLWPDILIEMGGRSRRHPMMAWMSRIEGRLYRDCDHCISAMQGADRHIESLGGDPERFTWVPNAVPLDRIPRDSPLPPTGTPFTFMYAGVLGFYNSLETVIDASAELERRGLGDRALVRIVGDGNHRARLEHRARQAGVRMIRFEDAVPKREVYARLAEAHAFLMVLRRAPVFRFDVSPNKLWDYMAMQRPTIYAIGNPYDPVRKANAGISVPPEDPVAMADAMERMMSLPESERLEMGRRARAHVAEHHDFGRLARRFEAALSRAITHRSLRTSA